MRRYSLLGVETAELLGRRAQVQRLFDSLSKATPDHVSVIGAKLSGKTVLLKHLAAHFSATKVPYLGTAYWDLAHGTPESDGAFLQQFGEHLHATIERARPQDAAEIRGAGEHLGRVLPTVLDMLAVDKQKVLVIMDGFDRVLASSTITRNLWDNMRALAQKSSLRLVTGSRKRLQELCHTEESRTSDFWEIFNPRPVVVGPLEGDKDWSDACEPLGAVGPIEAPALAELKQWTGGVPVLVAAVGLQVLDGGSGAVSKDRVASAAGRVLSDSPELLQALWDDCDLDLQTDLARLAQQQVSKAEVHDVRRRALIDRGLAVETDRHLVSSCRLMSTFAKPREVAIANLRRVAGDAKLYDESIASLVELRLSHLRGGDRDLRALIENAVQLLKSQPTQAFVPFRGIANRALRLIWARELENGQLVPEAWIEEWKHSGEAGWDKLLPGLDKPQRDRRAPQELGRQCRLLDVATGGMRARRQTRLISKATYVLVNHAHAVGNYGQHMGDETPGRPFAASNCLMAVELLESLSRELA